MNIIDIQQVNNDYEKTIIADNILRQTPELLEIQKSISDCIEQVKGKLFFAVFDGEEIIGFMSLKHNNPFTVQINLIGIINVYNRKEVCRQLVQDVEKYLVYKGYKFMIFSTLGSTVDYQQYLRTRELYRSVGFYPLEESKDNISEESSLMIMVKHLGG